MTPYLRAIGVLGANDPFRKIGFLVGLAMIFSAGIVDLTFIAIEAVRRVRARSAPASAGGPVGRPQHADASCCGSSAGASRWSLVATLLLGQPVGYVLFALVLVFLFVFINGISQGISDWNPISSAFVVSVLLMSAIGLRDPIVAMMAASVLLVVDASSAATCSRIARRAGGWDRSAPSSSATRRPASRWARCCACCSRNSS